MFELYLAIIRSDAKQKASLAMMSHCPMLKDRVFRGSHSGCSSLVETDVNRTRVQMLDK